MLDHSIQTLYVLVFVWLFVGSLQATAILSVAVLREFYSILCFAMSCSLPEDPLTSIFQFNIFLHKQLK